MHGIINSPLLQICYKAFSGGAEANLALLCELTPLCIAGATLVQLYTALAYEGPSLVPKMKQQLAACLEADGFSSVQEAIGVDHLANRP